MSSIGVLFGLCVGPFCHVSIRVYVLQRKMQSHQRQCPNFCMFLKSKLKYDFILQILPLSWVDMNVDLL